MPDKLFKFFRGEIKGINEQEHILEACVSTSDEDRDGDVVMPSAFNDSIKGYMDHPVLLSSHNYWSLQSQIGEATEVIVGEKDVRMKFKYLVGKGNQEADYAWELAKAGLAAFSIGFIGKDWEPIEKIIDGRSWTTGRKFTKIELMEVSQVLIPSNRGALQASAELCEMAVKAIDEKKLEIKLVKKEVPASAPAAKPEEKHYTEEILGAADEKSKAVADKAFIQEAIKQAVNDALKGGK